MSADTDSAVAAHYTTESLMERTKTALKKAGVDPQKATASDLSAGDQFHTGGLLATEHLISQVDISAETRVLDIGCGIGGTSRFVADRTGAHVTGIDLTPEFVETAKVLGKMVGLSDLTEYHVGSATAMPLPDDTFDLAIMMHVGMNVGDKPALFQEVARTLRRGGTFALFDVMRGNEQSDLTFPLPWSGMAETSFVVASDVYQEAALNAGFSLRQKTDRTQFAVDYSESMRRKTEAEGPGPFGYGLMMGETARVQLGNYVKNLSAGRLCPTEMIFELTE